LVFRLSIARPDLPASIVWVSPSGEHILKSFFERTEENQAISSVARSGGNGLTEIITATG
jgi:hypothetical protein